MANCWFVVCFSQRGGDFERMREFYFVGICNTTWVAKRKTESLGLTKCQNANNKAAIISNNYLMISVFGSPDPNTRECCESLEKGAEFCELFLIRATFPSAGSGYEKPLSNCLKK